MASVDGAAGAGDAWFILTLCNNLHSAYHRTSDLNLVVSAVINFFIIFYYCCLLYTSDAAD